MFKLTRITFVTLIGAGAAVWLIAPVSARADETLVDLRSDLIPTANFPKIFHVFPSIEALKDDTAKKEDCEITLSLDTKGAIQASPSNPYNPDDAALRQKFNSSSPKFSNFHSTLPICRDSPYFIPLGKAIVMTGGLGILNDAWGQWANQIIITPAASTDSQAQGVEMLEISDENHAQIFGRREYPRDVNPQSIKDNLKILQNLTLHLHCNTNDSNCDPTNGLPVTDTRYSKLSLKLTVTPHSGMIVRTDCVANSPLNKHNNDEWAECPQSPHCPNPNPNSLVCATSNLGNDFRMSLGQTAWHMPSECQAQTIPSEFTTLCDQAKSKDADGKFIYEGKFLYVVLQLHQHFAENDNAEGFATEDCAGVYNSGNCSNIVTDGETGSSVYQADLRNFLPSSASSNPFENSVYWDSPHTLQTQSSVANSDLMTLLKNAILGVKKNFPQALPPRICTLSNGSKAMCAVDGNSNPNAESDDAYVSHFYINTVDIGYELTGLSHLHFKVNDFTISGGCKSQSVQPPCNGQ